jgi:hypothetical protein
MSVLIRFVKISKVCVGFENFGVELGNLKGEPNERRYF